MNASDLVALDPGGLFDQALASSLSRVSTGKSPSTAAAHRRLPIRLSPHPKRVFSRETPREIALVDDKLKNAFRDLLLAKVSWPLFIHGKPGTGKTCGALALCDFVRSAVYTTVHDLMDAVFLSFRGSIAMSWKPYGRYVEIENERPIGSQLVVLDELGTRERVSDTQYDTVKKVLDIREHLPVILISNHPIDRIAEIYDARIASRCEAGTIVELEGGDRRTA